MTTANIIEENIYLGGTLAVSDVWFITSWREVRKNEGRQDAWKEAENSYILTSRQQKMVWEALVGTWVEEIKKCASTVIFYQKRPHLL